MIDFTNCDDEEIRTCACDTQETFTEWDTMTAKTFFAEVFFGDVYTCFPIRLIHYLYDVWVKEQGMPMTSWRYIGQHLLNWGLPLLAEYNEDEEEPLALVRGIAPKQKYRAILDDLANSDEE